MLFLLLGLLTWSEAIPACPSQCNCTETVVDCSHKGLRAFPTELPSTTITLNLRGNSIGRLSINDVRGLSHLETLIVSENVIRSVEENFFLDYLPLLRRITLARNKLRFIPSLAAQNSRLLSLDLRHNEIEAIDVQNFEHRQFSHGEIGIERRGEVLSIHLNSALHHSARSKLLMYLALSQQLWKKSFIAFSSARPVEVVKCTGYISELHGFYDTFSE
ncbi:leucine rich repeat domain protein [Ostertagia ostertagi]